MATHNMRPTANTGPDHRLHGDLYPLPVQVRRLEPLEVAAASV